MKTTTHQNLKSKAKIIGALFLGLLLNTGLKAQAPCQAAFTYTVGNNGQLSTTNTSTGTTANTTYSWYWSGTGGWGTSALASPTLNLNYNGTYYVSMSITDSIAGCWSSTADTIVVTNGQACQVSFTYTVGSNGLVNFTNTSQGSTIYYWNFGDGNTSQQTSPSNTYLYNGTYTVSLWSDTTGGGCFGYNTAVITISNATSCNVSASFTSSVNGSGVAVFTDTVTTNSGSPSHAWYVNGVYVGSGNPFTYPFNSNGSFSICETVYDSLGTGCNSSSCDSIVVSGLACNDSAFFYLYPDSTLASTWYLYLYATNNYPINAVWSWGDGTTSTGLYPSHVYANAGWYNICVTAYFACGDSTTYCELDSLYRTSNQMVNVNVINAQNAIKTNTKSMTSLKAYPNPFADNLTISLTSYENSNVVCTVYDMLGNQILTESAQISKGDNEVKLKTEALGKGLYFVNITNGKQNTTLKVIK